MDARTVHEVGPDFNDRSDSGGVNAPNAEGVKNKHGSRRGRLAERARTPASFVLYFTRHSPVALLGCQARDVSRGFRRARFPGALRQECAG